MADPAHEAAEEVLRSLDRRIASVYGAALADVKNQMDEFMATFEREDAKYRKRVENGSATEAQYRKWRRDQVMDSNRFKALVKSLSADLTRHTEIAMALVNGELPEIYAEAMNHGTFEVERGTTIETAFTLYDRSTVMGLLRDQPDLYPTAAVNKAKQQRWDRQHIVSAVTQGLLAGDPMDRIADRMRRVVGMDAAVAARAARTCVTAAENSGRVDSYRRAERLGIRVRKQWLATLDGRTRSSHRALDGESVEVEEEFSNGLKYPGDPSGPGRERYNCRCTLVADLAEFPAEQVNRASKLGDMSYAEWKQEHRDRTIPAPAQEDRNETITVKKFVVPKTVMNSVTVEEASNEWFEYESANWMRDYVRTGFADIMTIGGEKLSIEERQRLAAMADKLQEAASEKKTEYRTLYRGMVLDQDEVRAMFTPNSKVALSTLTSSATDEGIARIYASVDNYTGEAENPVPVVLEIQKSDGIYGYDRDGAEVVLPRGSEFRVTRNWMDEQGVVHVSLYAKKGKNVLKDDDEWPDDLI